MSLELYSRENIGGIVWPDTVDGRYARDYLMPIMQNGAEAYIRNVHNTSLMAAKVGDVVLPITVTDFHSENTYTVSPYSHYISYGGFEEVERLNNSVAEAAIRGVLTPIAWWFRRSDFDRVAYVNNWLLATNLYPAMEATEIEEMARALPDVFADQAVIFRSVDRHRNPHLFDALVRCGYRMVLSRQVWYQEPATSMRTTQFKVDMKRFRRSGYEFADGSDLNDADLERVRELYNMLYIDKYSGFNPQFTEAFFRLTRDCRLLHLKVMRKDERIDGVMGYFVRGGAMTTPVFGYEMSLPRRAGLYPSLSVLLIREALEHGLILHASAGVGPFKKLRGGVPVIEYNAVYDRHLPRRRRMPWSMLKVLSDRIAIPVFQKYGF
jgi:hypothetical protein